MNQPAGLDSPPYIIKFLLVVAIAVGGMLVISGPTATAVQHVHATSVTHPIKRVADTRQILQPKVSMQVCFGDDANPDNWQLERIIRVWRDDQGQLWVHAEGSRHTTAENGLYSTETFETEELASTLGFIPGPDGWGPPVVRAVKGMCPLNA